MDPREKTPSRDTVNHVGGNKPASASVEAGFSFSSPPPSSQPPGDLIYFRDRERRRGFKGSLEMREQSIFPAKSSSNAEVLSTQSPQLK